MIESKLIASFDGRVLTGTLPELCDSLLREQQLSWPQLTEGYAALKTVRVREVRCDGYSVLLQFNPQRIVSSGASVDPQSIRLRKCFLCIENLPVEQKGVLYKNDFLVLCNPAPILDRHYTIAHVQHIPQQIERFLRTLLELARDLSPRFTVFYNGPKCGASAPDHMHFQVGPTGSIPIEGEAAVPARRTLWKRLDGVSVCSLKGLGRQVVVLEGDVPANIDSVTKALLAAMRNELQLSEEPMVNILCSHAGGTWRVILFPRRKHRPEVYFKEGNQKVLISPASVDIGGLVVTPIEKDFSTTDGALIHSIFGEVSLEQKIVDRILGKL